MSNSVYYKATDEDGNTVIRHAWKKHKYLYIKNGKYVYPEDLYKTAKQKVKNYFTSPGTNTKVSQKSYGSTAKIVVTKKDSPFVRDVKKSGVYKTAKKISKGVRKTASDIDQNVSNLYKKTIYPHTEAGKIDAMNRKANARQKALAKQHKQLAVKDSRVKSGGSPVNTAAIRKAKAQRIASSKRRVKSKTSTPYKGPTSATRAQKAQHEKDFQKRVRAMNARTVAKKNADMVKKKQDRQMKQIAANVKKQNAPSTKVKKAANFAKKVATRDAVAKTVAARYLLDKASKSPTANAARAKAKSVISKGEYKITRAGEKLANDVKKTGVYKKAKKATSTARDRAITSAEVRNKANSVKSKAEYKLGRAGQKLANDAKPYVTSAKKKLNSASKNANKAYKSAKKEFNSISRDASKAYKTAKKKARKVSRSFNKAKRAGKAYLNYLTK